MSHNCTCIDKSSCCPNCFQKQKQELQEKLWDTNEVLRKLQKQADKLKNKKELFPNAERIQLIEAIDEQGNSLKWQDFKKIMNLKNLVAPREGMKKDFLSHQELIPESWKKLGKAILFFNDTIHQPYDRSWGITTPDDRFVEGIIWNDSKN